VGVWLAAVLHCEAQSLLVLSKVHASMAGLMLHAADL
jgi:hypothetical protein